VNGRFTSAKPFDDRTEPLTEMQSAVAGLKSGDAVYLSAWFFGPGTALTGGAVGSATTWGALFAAQASAGVVVRLLINDFDHITTMDTWLQDSDITPLNKLIDAMAEEARDNLKYIIARHPAHIGWIKSKAMGQGGRDVYVGSHHQKFMIVRQSGNLTAFCGGVDIEEAKAPAVWGQGNGINGWHDLHVKLEGPITHDLEKEFVMRWNRERGGSRRAPRPGWKGYEQLGITPASSVDSAPGNQKHDVEMLRTISTDGGILGSYSNTCHDIEDAYKAGISRASKYIYIENQYFKSLDLADWIIAQGTTKPDLIVIIVTDTFNDDGMNGLVLHGMWLRHEALQKIVFALGSRVAIFTLGGNRKLHSKLILVDDTWMCIGSANASGRSFKVDSELDIQTNSVELVTQFRTRLWAINLGVTTAIVGTWSVPDYLSKWNVVAWGNAACAGRTPPEPDKLTGACVVPFDYKTVLGTKSDVISDELTQLDSPKLPNGMSSSGAADTQSAGSGGQGDPSATTA